jgi:hypothetical protein
MLHQEKVRVNNAAFISKVRQISDGLAINPNWLMEVMNKETGGTFRPDISNGLCVKQKGNPDLCATGLIQFMPTTAKALGTSIPALRKMSNVKQLDYVWLFYRKYAGKLKSLVDLYLVTFYPYALGKSENYRFGTEVSEARAKQIVAQNPFDYNKDGYITLSDFRQYVYKGVDLQALNETDKGSTKPKINYQALGVVIASVALIALYNTTADQPIQLQWNG